MRLIFACDEKQHGVDNPQGWYCKVVGREYTINRVEKIIKSFNIKVGQKIYENV